MDSNTVTDELFATPPESLPRKRLEPRVKASAAQTPKGVSVRLPFSKPKRKGFDRLKLPFL